MRRPACYARAEVGGARFRLDLAEWPQSMAYLLGRYDEATVEFICSHLHPGGCFVDGGGHVGLIGSQVAMRDPRAQIYAFEPNGRSYEALLGHVELNRFSNYRAFQKGLSSSATTLAYDPTTASVEEKGDQTERIEVVTLDAFIVDNAIGQIDVLKLDIEGHELAALQGAANALAAGRIGAVAMERELGDTDAAERFLLDRGFRRADWPDPRPAWISRRRAQRTVDAGYVLDR